MGPSFSISESLLARHANSELPQSGLRGYGGGDSTSVKFRTSASFAFEDHWTLLGTRKCAMERLSIFRLSKTERDQLRGIVRRFSILR